MKDIYRDIIDLPHHVSNKRPQMPRLNRAAQFAPFAALTGYDAAVTETARTTDRRIELDENERQEIDRRLGILLARLPEQTDISITYFKPDERKSGGAYISAAGQIKKIDEYERCVVFFDGAVIPICDILCIEGEIFSKIQDDD